MGRREKGHLPMSQEPCPPQPLRGPRGPGGARRGPHPVLPAIHYWYRYNSQTWGAHAREKCLGPLHI